MFPSKIGTSLKQIAQFSALVRSHNFRAYLTGLGLRMRFAEVSVFVLLLILAAVDNVYASTISVCCLFAFLKKVGHMVGLSDEYHWTSAAWIVWSLHSKFYPVLFSDQLNSILYVADVPVVLATVQSVIRLQKSSELPWENVAIIGLLCIAPPVREHLTYLESLLATTVYGCVVVAYMHLNKDSETLTQYNVAVSCVWVLFVRFKLFAFIYLGVLVYLKRKQPHDGTLLPLGKKNSAASSSSAQSSSASDSNTRQRYILPVKKLNPSHANAVQLFGNLQLKNAVTNVESNPNRIKMDEA